MKNKIIALIITLIVVIAGIFIALKVINKTTESNPNDISISEDIHKEAEDLAKEFDMSVEEAEYLTSEDKEWVFQETYDNTQQMIKDQGGSDSQCFEAELDDLPIYLDYYKETFNGRVSPGIDTLREEYKTWRIEKYGDGTSSKSEVSKPSETTQQQKPSSTQAQQKPSQPQTQQKPSSKQNQSGSNSGNTSSSIGDLYTPGDPNYHDSTTDQRSQEQIEKDIQATEEACKNSGDYVFN